MNVSFEFFPPKTGDMESQLWESISRLAPLRPDFVSVTYGAGGTTRQPTLNTVRRIIKRDRPCAGRAPDLRGRHARRRRRGGARVRRRGRQAFRGAEGRSGGRRRHRLQAASGRLRQRRRARRRPARARPISRSRSAAYPEKHPESPDFATDIDLLKRKVDTGATRAITQFFFDNDIYERYVERVRRAGIYVPIVPGILPVHNFAQVARFAGTLRRDACRPGSRSASTDSRTTRRRARWSPRPSPPTRSRTWSSAASHDFHFYTMNRAQLVYAICHLLGLRGAGGKTARVEAAA